MQLDSLGFQLSGGHVHRDAQRHAHAAGRRAGLAGLPRPGALDRLRAATSTSTAAGSTCPASTAWTSSASTSRSPSSASGTATTAGAGSASPARSSSSTGSASAARSTGCASPGTTTGAPTALTLDGVGVELDIPGTLRFKGAVSYKELPGPEHRFDGDITLQLIALDLTLDGKIVIGTTTAADGTTTSFFALYVAVELPAGIPLWSTGLGLYGIAGLMAIQMAPGKAPAEDWFENADGSPGWYKRAPEGVTDLAAKWDPLPGALRARRRRDHRHRRRQRLHLQRQPPAAWSPSRVR